MIETQAESVAQSAGAAIPERVLYSIPEASHLLGDVGVSSLYRWKSLGLISFVKVAKRSFVHRDEIARVAREGIAVAA